MAMVVDVIADTGQSAAARWNQIATAVEKVDTMLARVDRRLGSMASNTSRLSSAAGGSGSGGRGGGHGSGPPKIPAPPVMRGVASNYQNAYSALQGAMRSGDPTAIANAQDRFNKANSAMNRFNLKGLSGSVPGGSGIANTAYRTAKAFSGGAESALSSLPEILATAFSNPLTAATALVVTAFGSLVLQTNHLIDANNQAQGMSAANTAGFKSVNRAREYAAFGGQKPEDYSAAARANADAGESDLDFQARAGKYGVHYAHGARQRDRQDELAKREELIRALRNMNEEDTMAILRRDPSLAPYRAEKFGGMSDAKFAELQQSADKQGPYRPGMSTAANDKNARITQGQKDLSDRMSGGNAPQAAAGPLGGYNSPSATDPIPDKGMDSSKKPAASAAPPPPPPSDGSSANAADWRGPNNVAGAPPAHTAPKDQTQRELVNVGHAQVAATEELIRTMRGKEILGGGARSQNAIPTKLAFVTMTNFMDSGANRFGAFGGSV